MDLTLERLGGKVQYQNYFAKYHENRALTLERMGGGKPPPPPPTIIIVIQQLNALRERCKIKNRLNLGQCPNREGGGLTDHQYVPTLILINF